MDTTHLSRGAHWLAALTAPQPLLTGYCASLQVVDAPLAPLPPSALALSDLPTAHATARFMAVVPDAQGRWPRARGGEVGLQEGWELARAVHEVIQLDRTSSHPRAIVAVVDVPSQAYGRREEAFGIHLALAAAAGAYAQARLAGHPVIGLLVGKAMSGAFLAHGYQANRLIALRDKEVMVHAMGKASAARVTLRSVAALEALAARIAPMAYDIDSFASLGLLWRCLDVSNADAPSATDVQQVRQSLLAALHDIRSAQQNQGERGLMGRLAAPNRKASRTVREQLQAHWN